MIDIDELETLAKAALWTGDWNASCGTVDCAYPADSKFAGEFDEIAHPVPVGVSDYIEAAQPKAILALIAEVRALREQREGPGTPSARLNYLHGELNARFPDAIDVFSSEPPEPKFIAAIDAVIAEVRALREDAERYRWLRQQNWNEADMFVIVGSKSQVRLGTDCPSVARLDDVIDAARGTK